MYQISPMNWILMYMLFLTFIMMSMNINMNYYNNNVINMKNNISLMYKKLFN